MTEAARGRPSNDPLETTHPEEAPSDRGTGSGPIAASTPAAVSGGYAAAARAGASDLVVVVHDGVSFQALAGGGERWADRSARALGELAPVRYVTRRTADQGGSPFQVRTLAPAGDGAWQPLTEAEVVAGGDPAGWSGVSGIVLHQPFRGEFGLAFATRVPGHIPILLTDLGDAAWRPQWRPLLARGARELVLCDISKTAARISAAWFPSAPVTVVYGGLDARDPLPADAPPADPPTAVYVGRLLGHKGVHVLIQALGLSAAGWRLVCCSSAVDPAYCTMLDELARRIGVTFEVRQGLSDSEVDRVLSTATVAASPSVLVDHTGARHDNSELLGLSFLEHLARGVPTLASDIPAHREIAQAVRAPDLLVPAGDPSAWAVRLAAARRDPAALRARVREAGALLPLFGWPAYAENLRAVIRQAIST